MVGFINKNAHPLVAGAVGINSTASLPSTLYFDALGTRFHRIIRILSVQKKIRMSVEVFVFDQRPSVLCHARCQHVGDHSRHCCGSQHVIHSVKTFAQQHFVHVIKEVVNILHCHFKILPSKLKGEHRFWIECVSFDFLMFGHFFISRRCSIRNTPQSLRKATSRMRWSAPLRRIAWARWRVGRMFLRRLARLIEVQIASAVCTASSSESFA